MQDTLRERLSDLAHAQWSGWMEYLFQKSTVNEDGTVTIPQWAVERWKRQVNTPYSELSEQEKDNDRNEADRVIAILKDPKYPIAVNYPLAIGKPMTPKEVLERFIQKGMIGGKWVMIEDGGAKTIIQFSLQGKIPVINHSKETIGEYVPSKRESVTAVQLLPDETLFEPLIEVEVIRG